MTEFHSPLSTSYDRLHFGDERHVRPSAIDLIKTFADTQVQQWRAALSVSPCVDVRVGDVQVAHEQALRPLHLTFKLFRGGQVPVIVDLPYNKSPQAGQLPAVGLGWVTEGSFRTRVKPDEIVAHVRKLVI